MDNITFRQAQINDYEYVIPLMFSAASELHNYLYPQPMKYLEYSFKTGKGYFSYKKQIVGIINNKIIFSGTVYSENEFLKLTLESLFNTIKYYRFKSLKVFIKAYKIRKLFLPPSKNCIYIANLGTNSEYRGKGIGTSFFYNEHNKAKKNGYKFVELDVSCNNHLAQKLYEKLGYSIIAETKPIKNFSGIRKMIKKIN